MNNNKPKPGQCEGYRRYGGAFTLGHVSWVRCKNKAIVMLKIKQDGQTVKLPGCSVCWKEATETKGIKILEARPI